MLITFDPTILLLKLFPKVIIEMFRKNFLHKVVHGSIYLEQQKIENKKPTIFL